MIDKTRWKKRFREILSIDRHPGHIATGFAVGVFISFTPPVPGLHTGLALAVAFVFRLNKITTITGAWVNSPLTVLPSIALSYNIGKFFLGGNGESISLPGLDWHSLKGFLALNSKPYLLGCSILGFCAAILGYAVCYYLIVRFRKKDETLAELTMEMEEIGEELDE